MLKKFDQENSQGRALDGYKADLGVDYEKTKPETMQSKASKKLKPLELGEITSGTDLEDNANLDRRGAVHHSGSGNDSSTKGG